MQCKYKKICEKYSDVSITCNKNGGEYYGAERFAGCYRDLMKEEEDGK